MFCTLSPARRQCHMGDTVLTSWQLIVKGLLQVDKVWQRQPARRIFLAKLDPSMTRGARHSIKPYLNPRKLSVNRLNLEGRVWQENRLTDFDEQPDNNEWSVWLRCRLEGDAYEKRGWGYRAKTNGASVWHASPLCLSHWLPPVRSYQHIDGQLSMFRAT